MSDYVVCVRNIEKGEFGNEPGVTYFLEVPSNKANMEVGHKVSKKSDWFKTVLKNGVVGTDDDGNEYGDILVFIHGYNTSQSTVLKRHRQIKKSLKKEGFKGEVVSFDYIIRSDQERDITYAALVECDDAPIPLVDTLVGSVGPGKSVFEKFEYLEVNEEIITQECKAVVLVMKPEETTEEEYFNIISRKSLDFQTLFCKDKNCLEISKIFYGDDIIYLNFDSDVGSLDGYGDFDIGGIDTSFDGGFDFGSETDTAFGDYGASETDTAFGDMDSGDFGGWW